MALYGKLSEAATWSAWLEEPQFAGAGEALARSYRRSRTPSDGLCAANQFPDGSLGPRIAIQQISDTKRLTRRQ